MPTALVLANGHSPTAGSKQCIMQQTSINADLDMTVMVISPAEAVDIGALDAIQYEKSIETLHAKDVGITSVKDERLCPPTKSILNIYVDTGFTRNTLPLPQALFLQLPQKIPRC